MGVHRAGGRLTVGSSESIRGTGGVPVKPNAHVPTLCCVAILSALGVSCGDDGGSMSNQQIAEEFLSTVFNDRDPAALPSVATDGGTTPF